MRTVRQRGADATADETEGRGEQGSNEEPSAAQVSRERAACTRSARFRGYRRRALMRILGVFAALRSRPGLRLCGPCLGLISHGKKPP
ncbi:Hypothetical protein CAP_1226 [Chondromyces apiculatus DSM 436]|uniref:Uncharacterized protein n=1 Tax=Chondromyces apiculatus DSM 436 TaxID=1192034 RepID=A0A017TDH5_9BACT|nr:Hypothetical protein CAP_1226 [Chondromyces apiculatus DSM 436]